MKTVDFSETIATSDLKVGLSRHLIEFLDYIVFAINSVCFYYSLSLQFKYM